MHTNVDGVDASGVGAAAKRDTTTTKNTTAVFPRDGTADSLQNQRLFEEKEEEEEDQLLDFIKRR